MATEDTVIVNRIVSSVTYNGLQRYTYGLLSHIKKLSITYERIFKHLFALYTAEIFPNFQTIYGCFIKLHFNTKIDYNIHQFYVFTCLIIGRIAV